VKQTPGSGLEFIQKLSNEMASIEIAPVCKTWMSVGALTEGEVIQAFLSRDEIVHLRSLINPQYHGLTSGFNAIKVISQNRALVISGGYSENQKGVDRILIHAVMIIDDLSGVRSRMTPNLNDSPLLNAALDFLADYAAVPFSWTPAELPSVRQAFGSNGRFDDDWMNHFVPFGDKCYLSTYYSNGEMKTSTFSFYKYKSWYEMSHRSIDIDRLSQLKMAIGSTPEAATIKNPVQFLLRKCLKLEALIDDSSGSEEVVHQWLKRKEHYCFLDLDAVKVWSKVPFGAHVSDFVIRKSDGSYQLIEIEAPRFDLFRKGDDEMTAPLNHAISQTKDEWHCFKQLCGNVRGVGFRRSPHERL